ncbi:hypothetical protein [Anaerobaca lacustris]|uniref:Uncharacterized protein n=1 Tax=Anaerobaca lacustris TaxID=3044600 RepID=A0AAW6TQP4_9BACT|nr:hypothetical protein [Sedimentisphaerales bacterium M17dextr]
MRLMKALSSPVAIKLALAASGVQAARIDYDQAAGEMVLSILVGERIHHHRIPTSVTYTLDEISAWLSGEDPFEPSAEPAETPALPSTA